MTCEGGFLYRRRAIDGAGRFKDRPVLVAFGLLALVLIVFGAGMAAAYFQSYAPEALFMVIIGGASAALFCWIFFYFSFAGAGPWSLHALIASSATASGREKAAS